MDRAHPEPSGITGVWIAGACGDIAATTIVGASAIARGLAPLTGLVSALDQFAELPLVSAASLRFGGIDIGDRPLAEAVSALHSRSHTIPCEWLVALADDVGEIERDIAREPTAHWDPSQAEVDGPPLAEIIERLRGCIRAFRQRNQLDRVVVVNLTSATPEPAPSDLHRSAAGIERIIANNDKQFMSPSACYAWAAVLEHCPYVNFTPNGGADWPGLAELAHRHGVPFYGDDGKTGETLVKTALGPMFAYRNLEVLSWEGVNLLGNSDGRSLAEPRNRMRKMRNKERVLEDVLGYAPHSGVTINYVPSLGDWKTAWDLIHFRGFLDVPMTMQFTWQGCDSILAAPLVLDLVRFADLAARSGESGLMTHLASFFKHPLGCDDMVLSSQFQCLLDYASRHGGS